VTVSNPQRIFLYFKAIVSAKASTVHTFSQTIS